jgi:hypothetical protein
MIIRGALNEPRIPLELTLKPLPISYSVKAPFEVAIVWFSHGTRGHLLQILKDLHELRFGFEFFAKVFRFSQLSYHAL